VSRGDPAGRSRRDLLVAIELGTGARSLLAAVADPTGGFIRLLRNANAAVGHHRRPTRRTITARAVGRAINTADGRPDKAGRRRRG
jgi:hypothetical protein